MERIQALIDKLYQQKQQNSHPAQLLLTVQLLQSELLQLQQKNGTLGTAKVAVTLPVNLNFTEEMPHAVIHENSAVEFQAPAVEKLQQPQPVAEAVIPVSHAAYQPKEYKIEKPEPLREPSAPVEAQPLVNPAFHTAVEAPTLTQHQPKREMHEVLAEKRESLNDRLKQEKTEVAHALKESPIRDLRKGIGINDRFTFVNELFRGDEAMYERSIKTINGFHILSEAEYWINRELKFKLGWNDSKETVQHFYQLVRRRFA
jgi:hypothetical protein